MFENVETLDAILQLPNPEILLNQIKFNISEMHLHTSYRGILTNDKLKIKLNTMCSHNIIRCFSTSFIKL